MSFDSFESFESDELEDIGLFASCSAVYQHLSDRDGMEPNYWCWETTEGDWKQIFTMIMFMFALNLGLVLLTYGAITTGLSKIAGMKQRYVAQEDESLNLSTSWNAAPEPIWRGTHINNVSNIPMILIMLLLVINTIFYLAIKVFIVSHPSSHYINTTNDQFREMSFYSFFNTREIILMYIFTVNSWIFWLHQKWYYPKGTFPAPIQSIAQFARLISLVDFIFTVIVFCIYYPLLLIWLYIVGISIVIIAPLMCFVTCFVAPIVTCCMVPCIKCCLMGCVRVETGREGEINNEQNSADNAEDNEQNNNEQNNEENRENEQRDNVIICRCMNNCVRFLFGIIVGICEIFIYFVVIGIVLSFAFLIIDGIYGPSHVVFYMDFNSEADLIIYWLYLITISVGVIGLIIGLFTMIFIDGMRYQHVNRGNRGNTIGMVNNNNNRREEQILLSNDSDQDYGNMGL
eukprot:414439_1